MWRKGRIGKIKKTHEFLKYNEYIVRGYRKEFQSSKEIVCSLFSVHNQTVNVWTHLGGLGVFFGFVVYCVFVFGIYTQISREQVVKQLFNGFEKVQDYTFENEISYLYWTLKDTKFIEVVQKIQQQQSRLEEQVVRFYHEITDNEMNYLSLQKRKQSAFQLTIQLFKQLIPKIEQKNILRHTANNQLQRWPIYVFLVCASICFFFSSIFHLFNAHTSCTIRNVFTRLDYAGISILIAGSFYPPIYYYYYCFPHLIQLYLGSVTACSIVAFSIVMMPNLANSNNGTVRGFVFSVVGLLGLIPCFHMWFLQVLCSAEAYFFLWSLFWYITMGVCYLLGLVVFLTRYPQRYYPGKFDLIGNSHNIWHCFVVLGAIFHFIGVLDSFHTREYLSCY